MLATLDFVGVRRFTDDMNANLLRCDNGEGMECNTLEKSIETYVRLCKTLRECVNRWAMAVFAGDVAFDARVGELLRDETKALLARAGKVAERGRTLEGPCYFFEGLNALHRHMQDLQDLLREWVSPRLAVGPAPRVKIPEETRRLIAERLLELQPLPSDWTPTDPEQLAFFRKQQKR